MARELTGAHVLAGLFAFFGVMLAANGVFVYVATTTFSGLSTDDAYRKGLSYNETIRAFKLQSVAFLQLLGGILALRCPSLGIDQHRELMRQLIVVMSGLWPYANPSEAVAEAGIELLFPIEVRCAAADDIALSTAYGRESAYIAVHRTRGIDFRPYFEIVEAIMDEFAGRPHWGKMHFQTAATLAPRYPKWDDFQKLRTTYDPDGVFSNEYTDRVLGPVT